MGDAIESAGDSRRRGARALLGLAAAFAVAALALNGIFSGAEWYADNVSMARYCDDPGRAAEAVRRIMTEAEPAGAGPTRSYVVVAKLIYLAPRRDGESVDAYVRRLRWRIEDTCRRPLAAAPSPASRAAGRL